MDVTARTCGLGVVVRAEDDRWAEFAEEAFGGADCLGDLGDVGGVEEEPDVVITIERSRRAFDVEAMTPLTRGAFTDGRNVHLIDACGSGLDLLIEPREQHPSRAAGRPDHSERSHRRVLHVTARMRPRPSQHALKLVAPARTHLLFRAALLQYPVLWWAGLGGAVPLHVSAAVVRGRGVVLGGPGGVGKSTLMQTLSVADGSPLSDNLCTYDGTRLFGLQEPRRVETPRGPSTGSIGSGGRKMPHGRREQPWDLRAGAVSPGTVLVLRRGAGETPVTRPLTTAETARVLTAGTYAAGELRRYWAFAATLALGTGLGPAHPPVFGAAMELADSVPCVEVVLPGTPGTPLTTLVELASRRTQVGTLEASA